MPKYGFKSLHNIDNIQAHGQKPFIPSVVKNEFMWLESL